MTRNGDGESIGAIKIHLFARLVPIEFQRNYESYAGCVKSDKMIAKSPRRWERQYVQGSVTGDRRARR